MALLFQALLLFSFSLSSLANDVVECNESVQNLKVSEEVENYGNMVKCESRKKFFQQPKRKLFDVLKEVDFSKSDIIFLGVEHWNYESETYPKIINALLEREVKIDCYYIEVFFSEDSLESKIIKEVNSKKYEKIDWGRVKENMPFYLDIFQSLKLNDIQIHAIDNDVDYESDLFWLNERDKLMSETIKKNKENGLCKKAFYPVGASHILTSQNQKRENLVSQIDSKGITSSKMLLSIQGLQSGERKHIGSIWSFSQGFHKLSDIAKLDSSKFLCNELPKISTGLSANLTKGYDFSIVYDATSKTFLGDSSDIEVLINYTCETSKCKNSNKLLIESLEGIGLTFY